MAAKKGVTKKKEVKPKTIKEEFDKLDMDINDPEDVLFYEQQVVTELPPEISAQASIADILKRNKKN